MNIAIVSPHTDDAIFSLASFMQFDTNADNEFTVISPFAGIPEDDAGKKKHTLLRKEHESACKKLGLKIINGDYFDDVYPDRSLTLLQEWLFEATRYFETVIIPLGIHHPDHILVRKIFDKFAGNFWYYEELPYRVLYPHLYVEQVHKLGKNYQAQVFNHQEAKIKAVECYQSQIVGGKILEHLYVNEGIWIPI